MRVLTLFVALLVCACRSTTTTCNPGDSILNATLYMQSSAEYRAAALQTYATARRALDAALAENSGTLPPAIILDLDETALDNARYAARSVHKDKTFQFDDDWTAWVAESAADAVPGSAGFLAYASSRGVTPFYITNRTADMEAATRVNLQKLGFPLGSEDTVLVRGERPEWNTFDKTPRRDFVAAQYRVLLLLGDDLNDFTSASGKSVSERAAIVDNAAASWGTRWIIVPNPIYGSWESAVTGGTGTQCEQMEKKSAALVE